MAERTEWSAATWEGNRLRQQREFLALPFREKLMIIEQMGDVVSFIAERRRSHGLPMSSSAPLSGEEVHEPAPGPADDD